MLVARDRLPGAASEAVTSAQRGAGRGPAPLTVVEISTQDTTSMAAASDRSPPLRLFEHGCVPSSLGPASLSSKIRGPHFRPAQLAHISTGAGRKREGGDAGARLLPR